MFFGGIKTLKNKWRAASRIGLIWAIWLLFSLPLLISIISIRDGTFPCFRTHPCLVEHRNPSSLIMLRHVHPPHAYDLQITKKIGVWSPKPDPILRIQLQVCSTVDDFHYNLLQMQMLLITAWPNWWCFWLFLVPTAKDFDYCLFQLRTLFPLADSNCKCFWFLPVPTKYFSDVCLFHLRTLLIVASYSCGWFSILPVPIVYSFYICLFY